MQRMTLTAIGFALLVVTLFVVAPSAQALPQNWTHTQYFDENWDLIGEKEITCSGYHSSWGVTTGAAHITGYEEPCSGGSGTWHCYYLDDECGCYVEVDLIYCGV
jgi:hypothetical protein